MIAKERNIPYGFTLVRFETGDYKQPAHLAHQPFGQVRYISPCVVSLLPHIVTLPYAGFFTLLPLLE